MSVAHRTMNDKVARVLDRLEGVRGSDQGNKWEALCPAHEDREPSLSVGVGKDGRVLLCCHAGCAFADIVAALQLEPKDCAPDEDRHRHNGRAGPAGEIVATYDYQDEDGKLLFQAVRKSPKQFLQRRPDPRNPGRWLWNLGETRRVLYRLPDLLAADRARPVHVVEGEKDVETLRHRGLLATCNPMGAGKWSKLDRAAVEQALSGRHVVILPDNDNPGTKHAQEVARDVSRFAASVKVLRLPGLADGGDVSDWFDAGGTAPELEQLAGQVASDQAQAELHLTDLGNARRVVARHGRDLHYCYPWKAWHTWDGKRWAEDQTGEVVRRVKQTQGDFYLWAAEKVRQLADAGDGRKEELAKLTKVLDHAKKWEDARAMSRCIDLARSEPGVPVLPADFDAYPFLLNCLNGTLDLRTGTLRPHRREDLLSKLAPVDFDPAACCPTWERFLDQIMDGNKALVRYLQRVVGYALTGDVSEQQLWFFHGGGANGKSTFLVTVLALLGDYGMQAVSDLLMQKNHEAHPTERADLFGRRLAATIETEEGKRLAEALLKQVTGGDRIRARKCFKDFFEFDPTHKIILAANHKPVVRGTDGAIWRRIKLVPFTVTIPENKREKDLPDRLRAELPGILTWAVEGCLAWQLDGLGEPEEVRMATQEYQAEQDVIAGFLAECCTLLDTVRVRASALYEAYQQWSGDKLTTQRTFGDRLREKGYESVKGHGGVYYWLGIGLSAPELGGAGGVGVT